MTIRIFLADYQKTLNLGFCLGANLPAGVNILLSGNLGAGKTTLVQGLGLGLGIKESVVSPTFTLINEYLDGRLPLYHLDLYRLESSQVNGIYPEIYWEGIEVELGITAIEWSEHLLFKPPTSLEIELEISSTKGRHIKFLQQGKESYDLHFLESFTNQIKE